LRTFDASYFGPLNRKISIDVINTDRQDAGIQSLNLAGDPIVILHDDYVDFVSRHDRRSEEKKTISERDHANVHKVLVVRRRVFLVANKTNLQVGRRITRMMLAQAQRLMKVWLRL